MSKKQIFLCIHRYVIFVLLFFFCNSFFPKISQAQDAQILSVTPPLFQLSAVPGDPFQSVVKVVNGNPYSITVYAEVVGFEATGELGQGKFVPLLNDDFDKVSLASWIDLSEGPYTIEPEQSQDISFIVNVPQNAAPGGHYAAILITTKPPQGAEGGSSLRTEQTVTSLFFLRVQGDIRELGSIREFGPTHMLVESPKTEFSLRFENKGNVHLQPKGDIIIYNMWGTERGAIPINYKTHYGNVLPMSIRDFHFTWEGNNGFADIGRFKAIVTLAYGEDGVKSVTSTTYFWVIPLKATFITLGILILFVVSIVWMVRLYVRRMLTLAGVSTFDTELKSSDRIEALYTKPIHTAKPSVTAPLKSGVLDLRKSLHGVQESAEVYQTLWRFIVQYKRFFIAIIILVSIFIVMVLYISDATKKHNDYTVIIEEGDADTTLQGSDIAEEKAPQE